VTIHRITPEARPGRMGPLATLPVFLALDGKRAMLVGGSAAAAWKGELLSAAGARVDVYAEEISDELRMIAADPPRGVIVVHKRACTADDLKGAVVAVGAFEEEAGATRFAQMARTAGVPVNIVDKPALSDFTLGAIVNRTPLVIGISTDGAAPVFAQAIRAKLEALLPRGFAAWVAAAQSWRAAVQASGLTFAARRKFWLRFATHAMTHAESEPMVGDFDRLIAEIKGHDAAAHGSVMIVNAGSGDAELLTLRAVRALQSADVILFDELVSHDVLDFARREARKLLVRRSGFGRSSEQDDINELMIGLAKKGKHVVRLKGGDSSGPLRGLAAEETTALNSAAVPTASAARSGAAA
jgi:uroporphyrin-III C-methyltransferase/precorrin-2 dehydrogenase/sirohydrochlorin ferrochelatase